MSIENIRESIEKEKGHRAMDFSGNSVSVSWDIIELVLKEIESQEKKINKELANANHLIAERDEYKRLFESQGKFEKSNAEFAKDDLRAYDNAETGCRLLGRIREARATAKEDQNTDGSRELSIVITKLEEAEMWRVRDLFLKTPPENIANM